MLKCGMNDTVNCRIKKINKRGLVLQQELKGGLSKNIVVASHDVFCFQTRKTKSGIRIEDKRTVNESNGTKLVFFHLKKRYNEAKECINEVWSMLKLAIIGTGAISVDFVTAAMMTGEYSPVAVYSRTIEAATAFLAQVGKDMEIYTSMEELCAYPFDVAYIGSPNALHFEQAKQIVQSGKHVIVEKPIFTTIEEWDEIHVLAKENGVYVLEAARHIYEKSHQQVGEWVRQHDIDGAFLSFAKYSSKYDDFLNGKIASSLSRQMAGGALVDLGVYPVYAAVSWFGVPIEVVYYAQMLHTKVDKAGTLILRYEALDVTIVVGKVLNSYVSNEIYAGKKTLCFNAVQMITSIKEYTQGQCTEEKQVETPAHYMVDEARVCAQVIQNKEEDTYRKLSALSRNVLSVLVRARHGASIYFENEKRL